MEKTLEVVKEKGLEKMALEKMRETEPKVVLKVVLEMVLKMALKAALG